VTKPFTIPAVRWRTADGDYARVLIVLILGDAIPLP
jgi:hypothetical protein